MKPQFPQPQCAYHGTCLCTSYFTGIPAKSGEVPDGIFVLHFQFLMDYNLYGMNLLHASAAKFRNPVRLVDGDGM